MLLQFVLPALRLGQVRHNQLPGCAQFGSEVNSRVEPRGTGTTCPHQQTTLVACAGVWLQSLLVKSEGPRIYMPEYVLNPPWWVVLIISVFLAKRWDRVEHFISATSSYLMNHTRGKLRGHWRSRRKNKLLKIKNIRNSHIEITKLITKRYTYLILFILLAAIFGLLITAAKISARPLQQELLAYSLIAAAISIMYEMLWLTTSTKVDNYITLYKAFKKTALRNQNKKRSATQEEIESEIIRTYLSRAEKDHQEIESFGFTYDDDLKRDGYLIVNFKVSSDRYHKRFRTHHSFRVWRSETPERICIALTQG
ncbi:hypothetical protein [Ectopseudomonas khazarica]|uniref:hypothetical protein n=1 Tax=Ectopseudomonas khazarica TaxID=2502979 RepID=UPI00106EABEF|nr:hypothetical protein [Pseudomonas khazarica]